MTKKLRIVVTGGAGYLGRCTMQILRKEGHEPHAIDDYSTSQRWYSPEYPCEEADLTDWKAAKKAWKTIGEIDGVIHFAAKALVTESHDKPETYFKNNLLSTIHVAQLCVESGVKSLIHSSSCAVYGIPEKLPVSEAERLNPISPYGETKRINEQILRQFALNKELKVINLRYFNPAGALEDGTHGEAHIPETHLIPNLVRAALTDQPFTIFGTDYETEDGTCVRDFIHVEDLAYAHLAALRFIKKQKSPFCEAINVGGGVGVSVRDAVRICEEVLQKKVNVVERPRRPGDPPMLIADTARASEWLAWRPTRNLKHMVESHWQWVKTRIK